MVTEAAPSLAGRVALVTGGGRRIGACISRTLHQAGMDIAIHYRHSDRAARGLMEELVAERPGSVRLFQGDLLQEGLPARLVGEVASWRGHLDLLVNNASSFFPTPLGEATGQQWEELMGSNLKAPFFLCQAAAPLLRARQGNIVNLVDIHADRPLEGHPIYSMAKAGNAMMVKALAWELGPAVRVNGIAPGVILWPESGIDDQEQQATLARTALKRPGRPEDIARTLLFLVRDADYITGQIIPVDGGRSIQQ
ncbi:MAG TPA: pteridine reductase [Sedimenticola sp.]|nr:pteridine reductase [Sedimenticola sp.]